MLKTLIKTRFQAMFYRKPSGNKKARNMTPVYVILYAYLIIAFGGMFMLNYGTLYDTFAVTLGLPDIYFAMAAFTSMMLGFVGSVMMTQSQLYEAKDNELLLSMPIKPSTILASRIIVLYMWSFAFSVVNYVPAVAVYIKKNDSLSIGFFVAAVLGLFLIPLFALTVSFIIAWLLKLATGKMKNKSLATIIGTFIFFGVYMVFCTQMYNISTILTVNSDGVVNAFKTYLYPFYTCGKALMGNSFAYVLLMILVTVIPFVLAWQILSKTFIKIATTKAGFVKTKYKAEKMKAGSVRNAVASKELKHFIASPTYAVNGGLGLLMMVGLAAYFTVKYETMLSMFLEISGGFMEADFLNALLILIVASVGTICEITVCSISLEGKNLWILKSAPISELDILKGKLYAHIYIAVPFALLSGIILNFMPGMSPVMRIFAIALPVVIQVFEAYFGLAVNLKLPKLDWNNESQAIKQSGAAMIAVFGGMGFVILIILLYMLTSTFINSEIFCLIVFLMFALGCVGYEYYLRHKGIERFKEL